jgi:hypothetical protein
LWWFSPSGKFAVEYVNLYRYVQEKVEWESQMQLRTATTPLLESALLSFKDFTDLHDIPICTQKDPTVELIKLLLKRGVRILTELALLAQRFGAAYLIALGADSRRSDSKIMFYWADIIEIFILHGSAQGHHHTYSQLFSDRRGGALSKSQQRSYLQSSEVSGNERN